MLVIKRTFTLDSRCEMWLSGQSISLCGDDLCELFAIPGDTRKITLELHTRPAAERAAVDLIILCSTLRFAVHDREHNSMYWNGRSKSLCRWIAVSNLPSMEKYDGKTLYLGCWFWE